MIRVPHLAVPRLLTLSLALLALAAGARAQGAPPSKDAIRFGSPLQIPDGTTNEAMWTAPTAEDWARPCLIPWQRSFDDALKVARETRRPILVCVNMDGEIASEHWAGVRYRQTETARLLEPFVCVIASVYRHTPRDYDAQGNRVPCPRFGGVTCGEHIATETALYDKFFDGKRISPRHLLLELDGTKTYDVYFSWDNATVVTAFREGAKDRPPPLPDVHEDQPLPARTVSADEKDRIALESAYRQGSREARRELLQATLKARDVDQVDLLRLAIFGLDQELARLARHALAQSDSEKAVDLIAETLKQPLDAEERAELVAAAQRLCERYPRARTLVAVQQGLGSSSKLVDLDAWTHALEAYRASAERDTTAKLDNRAAIAAASPDDPEAQLALAESLLARAQDPKTERRFAALCLEDARNAALAAEKLGAKGWRLDAALAVTSDAHGDHDGAIARALAAVEGGMPRPGTADDAEDASAVKVLALFAQARQRAIAKAYKERTAWPPEWLADIHAAYAVLAQHPLGTDGNVADEYDFLHWLGATPRANRALDEGLVRFPSSWALHERLRARILWEQGPEGLEPAYAERMRAPGAAPELRWFAGYAALVAAESHQRAHQPAESVADYERAIDHFQRDVEQSPEHRASAEHYGALAHAGLARVALERDEVERATDELLASFALAPNSAATLDGLNQSAVHTAKTLRARLAALGRAELVTRVDAGLARLDPSMLEPPEYERDLPGAPRSPVPRENR